MSSDPDRSTCKDPFQACLSWIGPNSPPSPVFLSDSPTHNPTKPRDIHQEPPPTVMPIFHLVPSTPNISAVPKSASGQSQEWRTFGASLKVLETGVGIFPPLKAAVSELIACTMHLQIAEENKQEYDQLASDLASLVQTLQTHLPDSKPKWTPYSIENVARSIGEQAAHIKRQQDRSGLTQAVRASDDEIDIIGCYRRIERIFRQLQTDISLSIWDLVHVQWVNICLEDLNPVHDARHNAAASTEMHRRGCTPNTRVKILNEAIHWTRSLDAPKIYWMNGMAGTGKTTIAYSLCERLEESKQLGACFFCSRISPDCRNVNRIVPTIAYQLARFSNPYQKELCEVLANNPDVAKREISVQFEKLIVGPLLKVKDAIPTDVAVIIDALDECSDSRGTQMVLELLFRHSTSLPVRFFATSRPEPDISTRVSSAMDAYRFVVHLHDVEESLVREDIHTYLEDELGSIEAEPEEIDRLTARAGRLFIFAATVVRYIEPHKAAVNHRKRLAIMLAAHIKDEERAYQELDELYLVILTQSLRGVRGDEGNIRRSVLQAVLSAREPLTIPTVAELIGLESGEVRLALLPLHSVLRVSVDTGVISTLHASFPDFMLDAARSGDFHCDMSEQNAYMAARCFEIMQKSLKFNICNLETSSRFDQDIPDLSTRVNKAISSGLSYASRYWGDHLSGAHFSSDLGNMLDRFLRYQLLFWTEVLNLRDWVGFAASILLQAFNYLPAGDSLNELRNMIQDCRNFVTAYAASPASHSTPHIYISALPLASAQSFIRRAYWPRMQGFVQIEGTAIKDRNDATLATWSAGSWVTKLALSKDGRHLVSASDDGTITVWDVTNGRRLLGPLKKHQRIVYAIAFSPDGTRIASGSYDGKIHLSNTYNEDTLPGLFEGHTASITGLVFSPDAVRLISCSEDHTIRIWDSLIGTQIGPELRGHRDCVMSIVLSSDGERLVSGSDDHTIRVWDLKTGTTVVGPLEGHTDWVDCIALSPDDKHIASSSRDCTVRVWSVEHGAMTFNPLLGHTDRVKSVAYSPDGKKIVSGSFDKTIRVWSSETGDLIAGPFQGHGDWVYSVLFSSDGTHIISGSGDGTIYIWDADHGITGTDIASGGHTDTIFSAVVSPDGTRVASGSYDQTIYVWDTRDGTLVLGPLMGHTDAVESVAYTPDGACIVSGSWDCTIRTWDAHTGLALADPFTGHTDAVTSVAVSPNSKFVVSGSRDYSIKVWNLQSGKEVANHPMHHSHWARSVEFSPNGSYIVSGSSDGSVCLWDTETGSLIRKFEQHANEVTAVTVSLGGTRITSCSRDETLLVWDMYTGAVLSGPWTGQNSEIWAVSFSPDGARIASGAQDGTICLWDAENGTILANPFARHNYIVYSVAFTPDNKHIISGSQDGTIRFWDLDSGDNIQQQETSGWVAQDDGWIRDSESRLILWLPPYLARLVPFPPCSRVIRHGKSIQINLGNFIHGDNWEECYAVSFKSSKPNV